MSTEAVDDAELERIREAARDGTLDFSQFHDLFHGLLQGCDNPRIHWLYFTDYYMARPWWRWGFKGWRRLFWMPT